MNYDVVIGLEVHAQLATNTKLFCGCRARVENVAEEQPNSNTCPVCTGQPGTLPVLNGRAVEYAVLAGLAVEGKLQHKSVFARKNYFYPDLPKGYQTSQHTHPYCDGGEVRFWFEGADHAVPLERIHMEEDAGKNVHHDGFSLVNLNRAGVPLIEIVSQPVMNSASEAGAYLRALHTLVKHLGICDGNLEEGNFRCDVNVSLKPQGAKELGTKVEIKNVNSFRFVERALEYEIARQTEVLNSGGTIIQETRTFDSAKNQTLSMRTKEEAQDYRYFPCPDLIPVILEDATLERIRGRLPELPEQKRQRYLKDQGMTEEQASLWVADRSMGEFFDDCVKTLVGEGQPANKFCKALSNLLGSELLRLQSETGVLLHASSLKVAQAVNLYKAVAAQEVSSSGAKQVLEILYKEGGEVAAILEAKGLKQESDLGAIEAIVDRVLQDNPDQVAQVKAGKTKVMGFLVGQIMKASKGKANPKMANDLLIKKLR